VQKFMRKSLDFIDEISYLCKGSYTFYSLRFMVLEIFNSYNLKHHPGNLFCVTFISFNSPFAQEIFNEYGNFVIPFPINGWVRRNAVTNEADCCG
jgi:hypothetical protein